MNEVLPNEKHLGQSIKQERLKQVGTICIHVLIVYCLLNWVYNVLNAQNLTVSGNPWVQGLQVVIQSVIPELFNWAIIILLVSLFRKRFTQKPWSAAGEKMPFYRLYALPVLLAGYLCYALVSVHCIFLLSEFPDYSYDTYLNEYVYGGVIKPENYLKYLAFASVYMLAVFHAPWSTPEAYPGHEPEQTGERETDEEPGFAPEGDFDAREEYHPFSTEGRPHDWQYMTHIKGRNAQGELILPVNECYWFETADGTGNYFAVHPRGRYQISTSLNKLEQEVDPAIFFRINRRQIINLGFLENYSYWEKGKYIVRLEVMNVKKEFLMPRKRLQTLKQSLASKK
jgi:hypothetical protein